MSQHCYINKKNINYGTHNALLSLIHASSLSLRNTHTHTHIHGLMHQNGGTAAITTMNPINCVKRIGIVRTPQTGQSPIVTLKE